MSIDDDAVVPSHYGNPFMEESRLRSGDAFTLLDWDVIAVSGADRAKLLHLISSQNFEVLAAGDSSEMLVLDAQGHIAHAAGVVVAAEQVWLLTEHGRGAALAEHIQRMTFMMRVETSVVDGTTIGLFTEVLPAELRDRAVAVWNDPWPLTAVGGAHYGVADADHPAFGSRRCVVVVPRSETERAIETLREAGLSAAGLSAWEAARVADWRSALSHEAAYSTLPHEVDWLRTAVHLAKGCYPGQETVAKLVNLGKPPRRLTFLYLEVEEDLPAVGSEVTLDGKPVGVLTSVARSVEDGPIGLALLKRQVPVSAVVQVGDAVASQVEIVGRAGKSSASPQQRPGTGLNSRRLGGPAPTMQAKSLGGK
ncbi:CAF17-like 4Fe-4S cluster assembly/insertion protein YgfZ [Arcanobacterium phocae]|uniref:CAF17-like 4Fe-4S cluster assembly/insertion protein YgfZ n=1 Tax=Arcanobacterium phocae TaxID=131112 RepID=UPI001C0EAD04